MQNNTERQLREIRKKLERTGIKDIEVLDCNGSVQLKGTASSWPDRVKAGYAAAGRGFRGVLNDIMVEGISEPDMKVPDLSDDLLEGRSFDAVIVGGGVIGCAIARELSKSDLSIAVLEKESDLAMQASGRNDGMIHPGFAATPGTKKAGYNVRGNRMYDRLSEELDFEFKRPGSILLFKSSWMKLLVPVFKSRCRKNGVDGDWRALSAAEVRRLEPNVTPKQRGGFLLPSAGIVSPYRVTLAFAGNAADNGAEFFLNTAVTSVESTGGRITKLGTNRGMLSCGVLINAAGVWADRLAELAGDRFFSIHGRKGTDAILDRRCGPLQNHILGMPSLLGSRNSHSKGGGLVPCVEGNILLGPTAVETPGREDFSTDSETFGELLKQLELNTELNAAQIINYYSGVRAANWEEDFIIEISDKIANLVYAAAIQSPGLASAPAIAEDAAALAVGALEGQGRIVRPRKNFNPFRRDIPSVKDLPEKERNELIRKDSAYGEVLCRCEEISRGEIRDALRSAIPATTVDGVKRRARAGAGRCHGGFCLPRIIMMMADETGMSPDEITKKGGKSQILCGETKSGGEDEQQV